MTQPEWRFPSDVPGWLLPEEGAELRRLATGKNVLELGAYCGRSTICLASTARHVVTIDAFRKSRAFAHADAPDAQKVLRRKLRRYRVADRVSVIVAEVADVLPWLDGRWFGMVFHDASHLEADVLADLRMIKAICLSHTTLAIHDYTRDKQPGVHKAVDAYLGPPPRIVGTMAIFEGLPCDS